MRVVLVVAVVVGLLWLARRAYCTDYGIPGTAGGAAVGSGPLLLGTKGGDRVCV